MLVCSPFLTSHKCGENLYPPCVWFADVMPFFSGVPFVFCFVFVLMLSLKSRPFVRSILLRYIYMQYSVQTSRQPQTRVSFFFLLTFGLFCLLIYLSLGLLGWYLLLFLLLFYFFPPLRSDRGRLFRLFFFLSFSPFICFFGCSGGMERETCVCDHGLERSDLCAEIIIIIII